MRVREFNNKINPCQDLCGDGDEVKLVCGLTDERRRLGWRLEQQPPRLGHAAGVVVGVDNVAAREPRDLQRRPRRHNRPFSVFVLSIVFWM